ncbi:MAG TPA: hypothetical protein VJS19_01770 [Candidatus Dormibacteraeota bacterium]|nr:hypothetical protein [Candidatus Dormibacteraeota bacterium]
MGKGRDKQGREKKKPKKAKNSANQPGGDRAANIEFRHHSVVMNQPETPTRTTPE